MRERERKTEREESRSVCYICMYAYDVQMFTYNCVLTFEINDTKKKTSNILKISFLDQRQYIYVYHCLGIYFSFSVKMTRNICEIIDNKMEILTIKIMNILD